MTTTLSRKNFRGPWTGLPVAWDGQDRFDQATYEEDVARCCRIGVPGIYTAGTTGEFYAMDFDEFKAITLATIGVSREHRTPVMIGCSSTYTLGAAHRAAFAAEAGADAIQVALPFWMELPDDQVVPFFKEVAAAAPKLALSVYETRRTKKALTLDQHRQIKDAIPEYLMVKANADTLGYSVEGCRELSRFVNVFVNESRFAELGRVGAAGGCSSQTYWFPNFIMALWKSVEAHDWPTADRYSAILGEALQQLTVLFSGRGFMDSALDRLGGQLIPFLSGGLRCRAPYPSATKRDVALLREWCLRHHRELLTA